MTVCSGCGVVTDTTICCPICLKHNKQIFYCSQECFEKNYSDHKKIHYFMKIMNSEEMHNRLYENNPKSEDPKLPVIILTGDKGNINDNESTDYSVNGNVNLNEIRKRNEINDVVNEVANEVASEVANEVASEVANEVASEVASEVANNLANDVANGTLNSISNGVAKGISKDDLLSEEHKRKNEVMPIFRTEHNRSNAIQFTSVDNNTKGMKKYDSSNFFSNNSEYNIHAKSGIFENMHRKKNYNKYRNIKNNYLSDDDITGEDSKNNIHKNNLKKNKSNSYMNSIIGYLFSNKYNMILPYYTDMSVKLDKINSKNIKMKNKLSDKKIMEIKKQLKIKKIFRLTILLVIISIIIILSTCIFSYILETSQKNIQINSENLLNKRNTNKNSDILELKSYINVIEDLRKEISEMKEVLYMHNIYINKNFNLNNSYSIFNNFNKMKPSVTSSYNKKLSDKVGSLTSHLYYNDPVSSSSGSYNNIANMQEDEKEQGTGSAQFTQYRYDINDIHQLSSVTDEKFVNNGSSNQVINGEDEKLAQIRSVSQVFGTSGAENLTVSVNNSGSTKGSNNSNENEIAGLESEKKEQHYTLNEKRNEQSTDANSNEHELTVENIKNFIKNHNESNDYEYAKISNVIVNEEKPINSKSAITDGKGIINDKEDTDMKNLKNENLIQSHQIKEKHIKYSSKMEDNENGVNIEKKFVNNKMNKKKQNTI
ncbi:HP12-like protein [Plasmodium brasilianum]|uniref:HP12 protein homolog, putative n=2 Tax=Plasmodium (Plasmodium) TaxID=418103 RepID=A0A1A8WE14_PLAMA|nr:HP12 protein homolog, putative [Plasmodium malariae]KAI4835697.1 HP12-like protein [Plasmodium brasilianum]SBS89445.1 conserved Plasmodium protein, unknown function [Plasmodium malariae]SCP02628.1 HP12 protein homolog, putative [Plasmodium malariae]